MPHCESHVSASHRRDWAAELIRCAAYICGARYAPVCEHICVYWSCCVTSSSTSSVRSPATIWIMTEEQIDYYSTHTHTHSQKWVMAAATPAKHQDKPNAGLYVAGSTLPDRHAKAGVREDVRLLADEFPKQTERVPIRIVDTCVDYYCLYANDFPICSRCTGEMSIARERCVRMKQ